MFNLFRKKQKAAHRPKVAKSEIVTVATTTKQHSNIQRELVRVVLKDTMRLHGIPLGWLACEVLAVPRSSGMEEMHIQLMVLRWNDKLMHFALALQQQLLLGLDRFDPMADHAAYVVSWRFSPNCGNPITQMPYPEFWLKNNRPPGQSAATIVASEVQYVETSQGNQFLDSSLFDTSDWVANFQATDRLPLR